MTKQEIIELMEDEVHTISSINKEYIETKNGLPNDRFLKIRKKILLENSVSYLAEELVDSRQSYPIDDVSEVDMVVDAVVIKRKDYEAILKYIEGND